MSDRMVTANASGAKPTGSLPSAAKREAHPGARIIVCADDDAASAGNPGMAYAREAARAIDALLAVPAFGENRPAGSTDFNDLHRVRGIGSVRDSISAARPVVRGLAGSGNVDAGEAVAADWPEPEPLTEPLESPPHPVEALPPLLRDAVTEAQAFVQAPMVLVVSSALSALSLAAQGVANVRFLIAWPQSTQGERCYRLAPESMPCNALRPAHTRSARSSARDRCAWLPHPDRVRSVAAGACGVDPLSR